MPHEEVDIRRFEALVELHDRLLEQGDQEKSPFNSRSGTPICKVLISTRCSTGKRWLRRESNPQHLCPSGLPIAYRARS